MTLWCSCGRPWGMAGCHHLPAIYIEPVTWQSRCDLRATASKLKRLRD